MLLSEMAREARLLAERELAARYPAAALLQLDLGDDLGSLAGFETDHHGFATFVPRPGGTILDLESDQPAADTRPTPLIPARERVELFRRVATRDLTERKVTVHFLAKSTRNPFAQMITLGRSPNNDLILEEHTVSKFHAYVVKTGERWTLHDQASANGTFLDGVRVQRAGVTLVDGSHVALGARLLFRFHTPAGLRRSLAPEAGDQRPSPSTSVMR